MPAPSDWEESRLWTDSPSRFRHPRTPSRLPWWLELTKRGGANSEACAGLERVHAWGFQSLHGRASGQQKMTCPQIPRTSPLLTRCAKETPHVASACVAFWCICRGLRGSNGLLSHASTCASSRCPVWPCSIFRPEVRFLQPNSGHQRAAALQERSNALALLI